MSKSPEFPTILAVTGWATAASVAAFVLGTTGHEPGPAIGPLMSAQAETPPAPEAVAAAPVAETPVAETQPIPVAMTGTPLGLGRPALTEEIDAWDVAVLPDGTGLPVGSGDVETGDEVFASYCAACHGDFAEGLGSWPVLAGGDGTLTDPRPVKTIGSYWPYLSTVFDYVHRSMPFGAAQTLTADDTYAITAFLLYSNGLVEDDFVLSNENFTSITMPNADGFYPDDRAESEYPLFTTEPCMQNCRAAAPEVTKRAVDLKVTPTDDDGKPAGTLPLIQASATPVVAPQVVAEAPAAPAAEVTPAAATPASADPALVATGEAVFKKCASCHKVGEGAKNAVGPVLNGIVGHPAGAIDGFAYSKPLLTMAEDGLVWDDASLAAFLENPRGFMKGTKMAFAGLKSAEDRAAVIAYLASLGG